MPLISIPIDRLCATDEDIVHRNVNYDWVRECKSSKDIGALLSFTMYPMKPIIKKPVPTAWLILMNSRLSAGKMCISTIAYGQHSSKTGKLTLLTSVDELHTIFQELPRHIEQFLHLV